MEWSMVQDFQKVTKEPNTQISGFRDNIHNWTKRGILWDLPYWQHQLLRRNLNVMHIEKNFSGNILYTIMDVPGKSKDNVNARLDLEALCARQELHIRTRKNDNPFKPKAKYTLSMDQRRALCEWLHQLSLPYGYSSNFANKVNASSATLQDMKSHDHHVFLELLLPIVLSSLPAEVLEPLSALSDFFKNLCANELREDLLMEMHRTIPIICAS